MCENACYQSVCQLPFFWKLRYSKIPLLSMSITRRTQWHSKRIKGMKTLLLLFGKITRCHISFKTGNALLVWTGLWNSETSASASFVLITCSLPEKKGGSCCQCANVVAHEPWLFHEAAAPLWVLPAASTAVLLSHINWLAPKKSFFEYSWQKKRLILCRHLLAWLLLLLI